MTKTARNKPSPRKNSAARVKQRPSVAKPGPTKSQLIISALQKPTGASLTELTKITGWQPHSIRGFLSGTVKKRADLTLLSESGDAGRRYRVEPVVITTPGK